MPFTPSHRRTADSRVGHDDPRRWPRRASAVLLAVTGGTLIAACGAGSHAASSGHTAPAHTSTRATTRTSAGASGAADASAPDPAGHRRMPARLLVRRTVLGRIIVDGHGRTLYMFSRDRMGTSTCRAMCARFWPPDFTAGRPTGGPGVSRALLGVSRAADGRRVVTYHGHPLYRFLRGTRPGLVTGEGVTAFGGRWDVLSPTGRAITGRHTRTAASRTTSTPTATATAPAAPPSTTTTHATPAPATTTHAAAPPTTTTHATSSGSGIPQNGGGDDDGDNHGAPSDGDGDL